MAWWSWGVFGFGLLIGEVLLPGTLFLLFFGVGALIVSVLVWCGLAEVVWVQWTCFGVLSAVFLLVFRNRLLGMLKPKKGYAAVDQIVGEVGTAVDTLTPGAKGNIELRGTSWTAKNDSHEIISSGSRVKVTAVHGLIVSVHKES